MKKHTIKVPGVGPLFGRRNPAYARSAESITDRAKRYRSQHPDVRPNMERCEYCGSRRNLVVHHRDGNEANITKKNLGCACKSCNGAIGEAMKRAGRGVRTKQYNPAGKSEAQILKDYQFAILVMRGRLDGDVNAALETIRKTPARLRSKYTREMWKTRRERYGESGRLFGGADEVPF